MVSLGVGGRSQGVEYAEALRALTRLLAALEGERQLSDATREAASVAAAAVGRAAKHVAVAGTDQDWRRRVDEQLVEARTLGRELEHRVGEMYQAMQEQEEWPAG